MREIDKKIVRWHTTWLLMVGLVSLIPYVLWTRTFALLMIGLVFSVAIVILFLVNRTIISASKGLDKPASEVGKGSVDGENQVVQRVSGWSEFLRPTIFEKEYKKIAKKVGVASILIVVSSHVFAWQTSAGIAIFVYLTGLMILSAWSWKALRLDSIYRWLCGYVSHFRQGVERGA